MGCENSVNNNIRENIIVRDKSCLICFEQIENECLACMYCRMLYHSNCYNRYLNNCSYCKCPHCNRIGTISTTNINYEYEIDNGIVKIIE